MFNNIYNGRKVFVTGHTGFKGSWLCMWLEQMGAEICGYALEPNTRPDHFTGLKLDMNSVIGDIRDTARLNAAILDFKPEIIFHLAAQPIVRESYQSPAATFEVNVQGTVNLLEAGRKTPSTKAMIVVTSDKCYKNHEHGLAFKEDDPMGGQDPYSASKGCAELVCESYFHAFYDPAGIGLCSCRSGNVIGGGDWAADRLVPDLMRAAAAGTRAEIRNARSVRPWQHVLEPLSGYLLLGAMLLAGDINCSGGWNFGPGNGISRSVGDLVAEAQNNWSGIKVTDSTEANAPYESKILKLDCTKASSIGWRPIWNFEQTVSSTVDWYREFYRNNHYSSLADLSQYQNDAEKMGIKWAL